MSHPVVFYKKRAFGHFKASAGAGMKMLSRLEVITPRRSCIQVGLISSALFSSALVSLSRELLFGGGVDTARELMTGVGRDLQTLQCIITLCGIRFSVSVSTRLTVIWAHSLANTHVPLTCRSRRHQFSHRAKTNYND